MKHVVIIGSKEYGAKNSPTAMADVLSDSAVKTDVFYWEDIMFDIRAGDVRVRFDGKLFSSLSPQLVIALGWYKNGKNSIYRDVAYAMAEYLSHNKILFWNSEMLSQRSVSKLSCMVQLAVSDIPVPHTKFALDDTALVDAALPFVAKSPAASRGASNYLVETKERRGEIIALGERLLVQPFLPNDHDIRVICFGGKPALALKRSRQGSDTHLNNTSQGGKAEWIRMSDLDPQLLTISEKICDIMKRELAGIDFIPDSSSPFGYSCLEVNAIPQLTSGSDVDIKMEMFKKITKEMI